MSKKFLIGFIIFWLLELHTLYFAHNLYFKPYLEAYAQTSTEQRFGSQRISPIYETMIRNIAKELNITEPFEIRKMNTNALQAFGYGNAFVYFPQLFYCIPLSNIPFLFISQSFFDDLTPIEQRFLIGHELVHIKKHHAQFFPLALLIIFGILLTIWWVGTRPLRKFFANLQKKPLQKLGPIISVLLLWISLIVLTQTGLFYRRHIEWEADNLSLELLNTYDGGIRLMDRWHQEFNMPLHHSFTNLSGLSATHPSIHERKTYFTTIKNLKENISCTSNNC